MPVGESADGRARLASRVQCHCMTASARPLMCPAGCCQPPPCVQLRDLFANTHPYLLGATIVVSLLHLVFEFLAFKVRPDVRVPRTDYTPLDHAAPQSILPAPQSIVAFERRVRSGRQPNSPTRPAAVHMVLK